MEAIRLKFTDIRSIRLLSIILTILICFMITAFIISPFKQAIIVFCCLMVFLLPCVFFMFFLNISKDYLIIIEDGIYIKGQLIKWNQIKKIYKTMNQILQETSGSKAREKNRKMLKDKIEEDNQIRK